MNKQLRIWLFALLGTLLASSSLLAEGVITMTTSISIGEEIGLYIEANGYVSISGVQEDARTDGEFKRYTLTSQTITIRGNVTGLSCREYRLTSLNLSGCTALTWLSCEENQLTSLDVSQNTALEYLSCSSNQLTSLDVSKNTALEYLYCSSNQLTSLDVSNHIALTTLNCSWNLLKKIELSGCTSIILLTCHRNQIKAPEMANLVNSLPDLQGKGEGLFEVFDDGSAEGNVCFAAHVATAQAKGWKTQFTRSSNGDAWYDYTGADNPLYAVSSSPTGGGSISFTGADNLNAVPYGTELTVVATPADGYKLTKLTANGQDILETKRFKVTENTEVKATFADNTGVETTVTQQVKLYPNPATDYVIVEGVAPASEVTLHGLTGERLYTGRADSRGVLQIDLTPYADGVYLVCVAGETYRVVVRH